jgi:tripartite ATP-independent transporter DctM subunit
MDNTILYISLIFLVLVLAAVPMAYAMLLTAAAYFFFINPLVPVTVIPQMSVGMISESFTLLAVPLFLLAGDLLNSCGMTERLVDFAVAVVGHIRGGIGHAVIVANIIMAGMSGSATADAAGIGSMMIPALKRAKFRPSAAAVLCASAATIGPIIPPSIPMVIYSSMSGVSLGRLLLAGIIPGLVMGFFLMIHLFLSPESALTARTPFSWRRLLTTGRDAVLAIIMPVIILGGMFTGVYTPTEGAAVAVAYAMLIGALVYHTLTPAVIFQSLRRTSVITGAVMFIVAAANTLSWILTVEHAGEAIMQMLRPVQTSPQLTLLSIVVLLLILGCFMEGAAILVLMTPVLAPVALASGIDPVHFGLVFVLAVMIGLITPPVGMTMFVTASIAHVSIGEFSKAVWRPFLALVAACLVVALWPGLVLFIPNLVMGK